MKRWAHMDSPVGPLLLVTEDDVGLRAIDFLNGRRNTSPDASWIEDNGALWPVIHRLRAYFAGELEKFDVEAAPEGTEFQKRVWSELCDIAYGKTISYGKLAGRIGNPKASRAVGLANGSNPIPIIIPCHRVIGSNGKLTGYGGGLEIKEKLLALEQRQLRFEDLAARSA